jgi:formylglycine-generating enzyme
VDATRLVTGLGAVGGVGLIAVGCACAGGPFELADDAVSQGGSAFPPLGTTDHTPDAGFGRSGAGGGSSEVSQGGGALPPLGTTDRTPNAGVGGGGSGGGSSSVSQGGSVSGGGSSSVSQGGSVSGGGSSSVSQGGSALPPLGTTDQTPNAGVGGSVSGGGSSSVSQGGSVSGGGSSSVSQGGSASGGGSSSAPPEPRVSPCGELRPGTSSDDGEICIPSGAFTMGNGEAPVPSGYTAHGPAHSVTLRAFVLDAKEVTVARYRACVVSSLCTAPLSSPQQGCTYSAASGSSDRLPVTCVSWNDAVGFCEWDGRRLPTEAEWERAARGTTGRTYAWGNEVVCLNAVFGGLVLCPDNGGLLPKPVGSTPRGASPEGALDLTGNAWEWVYDWFGPYPSGAVADPGGPDSGTARIQRGGNWQTAPASAAAFMRRAEAPASLGPTSFRCARAVP